MFLLPRKVLACARIWHIFGFTLFFFLTVITCFANQKTTNTVGSLDKIEFLNGDVLQGHLKGIRSNLVVEFTPSIFKNTVSIEPDGIGKLFLSQQNQTIHKFGGDSIIRLVNEDSFFGKFISLDKEKLVVETSFGGLLSINRELVKSLIPSSGSAIIYDGPNSLSEWSVYNPGFIMNVVVQGARPGGVATIQQPPSPWVFTNGALISLNNGAIGNFFDLPDKMSLDFELSWRGNLSFSVFFYTDSIAPYSGKSYMILFTYRAAYLHRRASVSGITVIGQAEIPEFSKESSANISIKVDKPERVIALFVNDRLIQAWKDEGEFVGGGNGIVFNQQSVSRVKISKIRITKWDGIIEEQLSITNKTAADIVKLTNKDLVEGKIQSLTNGTLFINTDFGPLEIPFDRVSEMLFENRQSDKKISDNQFVRGFLREYGSISFTIEKWEKDKIIGSAPGIGKITFSPSSFRVIQFNEMKKDQEKEVDNIFNDSNEFSE